MSENRYEELLNGGWSFPVVVPVSPDVIKSAVNEYLDKHPVDGIDNLIADTKSAIEYLRRKKV